MFCRSFRRNALVQFFSFLTKLALLFYTQPTESKEKHFSKKYLDSVGYVRTSFTTFA